MVLLALSLAAPARAFELAPPTMTALMHPQITKDDSSKVDGRDPEKLPEALAAARAAIERALGD